MSPNKGKFSDGQAYVAFSRVHELCKLHIVNYTRTKIHVSPHAEAEMDRLHTHHLVCTSDNHLIMNHTDINLLHINICNLKRKIPDIKRDMLFNSANIVSFNETHLSKSESLDSSMLGMDENFAVFRCDRDEAGGGVALFVRRTLNATQYQVHLPIEAVAVKIQNPAPIVIVSVYRPPTTPLKLFIDRFGMLLREMGDEILCIVGDFNEDILLSEDKPCCRLLKSLKFRPLVEKPTRDSGTLIDHMYLNSELPVTTDVTDCYYSDHDFVLAAITLSHI